MINVESGVVQVEERKVGGRCLSPSWPQCIRGEDDCMIQKECTGEMAVLERLSWFFIQPYVSSQVSPEIRLRAPGR